MNRFLVIVAKKRYMWTSQIQPLTHRETRYDSVTQLLGTEETTTYVSTDYSGGDVVLKLILKMK